MEKHILDILNDLYALDPSFREQEEELKKIIKNLLSSRPDVEIDEKFKQELKEKLLVEFDSGKMRKKSAKKTWYKRPFYKIGLAAAILTFMIAMGGVITQIILPYYGYYGLKTGPGGNMESLAVEMAPSVNQPQVMNDRTTMVMDGVPEKAKVFKKDVNATLLESSEILLEEEEGEILIPKEEAYEDYNTEEYDRIYENPFLKAITNPLSTFSIDVDTASYSNVRRFIQGGQMPYPDAVRIEELVNYFTYDYPEPDGEHPFSFFTEISMSPWNTQNKLLHIGIQGEKISFENLPPNNLVFLLDVSGSMNDPNKLPLLKSSFRLLIGELRPIDRVSIVVYAGAAGLVLPPTTGNNKAAILRAIDNLEAGGSTAGGEGIKLAYETAKKNLNPRGNNRIILATDGDFNVGVSSDSALTRLVEQKRKEGIFITVLGFGMGNYKDSKMEKIADKGNGNYAYIDTLNEAKKVLVTELGGTLLTIAKDVKIQIEFNPTKVDSYRLIGYENRLLAKEDFDDDTKDAGELGAGHTVTALYEIVPAGRASGTDDDLKYQTTTIKDDAYSSDEIMTLKFRYKKPDSEVSTLIEVPVRDNDIPFSQASENFRFGAAVAEWGLLLRNSEYKGSATYDQVLEIAREARGYDAEGYRSEFLQLAGLSKELSALE